MGQQWWGTAIGTQQTCSNKLTAILTKYACPWKGLRKCGTHARCSGRVMHECIATPCCTRLLLQFCAKQHVHPLTRHRSQRHRGRHNTLNGHNSHIHIHIIKSCSNIFGAQPCQQLLVPHVAAMRIVGIKGSQHAAANSKLSQTHKRIYN